MTLTYFLLIKFTALLFSFLGTGGLVYALRRAAVLDVPNDRSNHRVPTPRGAGLAVTGTLALFLLVSGAGLTLVGPLLWLGAVSFLDDRGGLSARIRFLAQLVAVLMAIGAIQGPVFQGLLPPLLDRTVVVVIWLWMINLTNFMDGIDGITGAQMLALGLGLAGVWWVGRDVPHALLVDGALVAAATAGFLFWNWHPAKIFLGDVGSVPLGFFSGFLLLQLAASGYWAAALILPAYYLTDASITLLKRLLRGEKIWEAHSTHFYQQAVRRARTHDDVVLDIAILNAVLAALAAGSTLSMQIAFACVAAAYVLALMLCFSFAVTVSSPSLEGRGQGGG